MKNKKLTPHQKNIIKENAVRAGMKHLEDTGYIYFWELDCIHSGISVKYVVNSNNKIYRKIKKFMEDCMTHGLSETLKKMPTRFDKQRTTEYKIAFAKYKNYLKRKGLNV